MSNSYDVRIQPQGEVLQNYFDSNKRVQVIRGPLGSGKTIQTCVKIPEIMRRQAPNREGVRLTRWIAARNTYGELFTTTIRDWLECNAYLGDPSIGDKKDGFNQGGRKPPIHTLKFKLEDGTTVQSEMWFISFDRPDHVKKARGLQLTGVWLNELKEHNKDVVDMLDLRHGRYPSKKEGVEPTWHGMLCDTNSPDEDHWLYDIAEVQKPEDWGFFNQAGGVMKVNDKWAINPNAENLGNLPANYYLKGMQGKSDDWIKVNLANEYGYVSTGKPVHPRYIDSIHCIDKPDWKPSLSYSIVLGFDFGRDPSCILMQEDNFGSYYAFDEFLANGMSANSFAPELAKFLKKNYSGYKFIGYGDPAGGQGNQSTDRTPFDILLKHDISAFPTEASNDILLRRAAVEDPLTELDMEGKPRLTISPKCVITRKGLQGGFQYARVLVAGDVRYHEKPLKNKYSHPVEALEYGMLGAEGSTLSSKHQSQYDDWSVPIN